MYRPIDLSSRLSADPNARAKIFQSTYPAGYRLHRHPFFEFSFAISGECLHILNGEPYRFCAGDLCLLTPSSLHQFIPLENAEPITIYTLSFSPEPIRPEFWAHIPTHELPIMARLESETFSAIRRTFDILLKRSTKEKLPFDLFTQTAIEWIILNIIDLSSVPHSPDYMKIRPALIYIQSNFTEQISLADAAASAFFSREYFSSLFRQTMGVSFQDYLLNIRLEYAADLLALTNLTVTEVCEQSGFQTLSYFIRAFTKKFDLSPRPFREGKRAEGIQPLPLTP